MRGSKRSDEQWQALFDEFERSGESAVTFCRERSLPAPYFRTKYRRSSSQTRKAAFTKVQVAAPTTAVSISLGEGQIRCDATVPSDWVARLIRQLQA